MDMNTSHRTDFYIGSKSNPYDNSSSANNPVSVYAYGSDDGEPYDYYNEFLDVLGDLFDLRSRNSQFRGGGPKYPVEEYAAKWLSISAGRDFNRYKDHYSWGRFWHKYFFIPAGYDGDMHSFKIASGKYEEYMFETDVLSPMERAYYTRVAFCGIGLIINIIHIVVFSRMGLKDGFVFVLFNIALCDLSFNVALAIHDVAIFLPYLVSSHSDLEIHPELLRDYFKPVALSMVVVNALLTTFLGVQRCLCVLMPLKFKGMFTWKKTFLITTFCWAFFIPSVMPPAIHLGLRFYGGMLSVDLHADPFKHKALTRQVDVANTVIVNWVCQIVLLLCVFIMARVLLNSVKFRQKASRIRNLSKETKNPDRNDAEKTRSLRKSSTKNLADSKEMRVIIQVTLLSIIFILAHIHYVVVSLMRVTITYYDMYPKYKWLDVAYDKFKEWFYIANTIVNIIIYLKYNSAYRMHFLGRKRK